MISAFIVAHGYLAVFAGTLLEGETILIAAGFAAHLGLLDWPLVVLVATVGATLGDQLAFLLGRWKGEALLQRFPALAQRKPQIHALLERFDIFSILALRFLYGLRIAGPFIIGSSRVTLLRFTIFNLVGAAVWAVLVSGAGYAFGIAIGSLFTDMKHMEEVILVALLALGSTFWLYRRFHAQSRKRADEKRG
jgi:membrane protein DedA with SNARE-associated domain